MKRIWVKQKSMSFTVAWLVRCVFFVTKKDISGWTDLCFGWQWSIRTVRNTNWHWLRCKNTENWQAENDLKNKEPASGELSTKTVKAVAQVKDATGAETRNFSRDQLRKAAADSINKVKQDLATKEIGQQLKQEIENSDFEWNTLYDKARTRDRRELNE